MKSILESKFSSPDDSKLWAQIIAFGPVMFQVARCLRDFGILTAINDSENGLSLESLTKKIDLSKYGVSVLLDGGISSGLISQEKDLYTLTAAGKHIQGDRLTNVNMNFTHDVCYEGMFALDKSLAHAKPEGLKVFGNWPTIYEGLTQLPDAVLKSWLEFDHYFSDDSFPRALNYIFKNPPKKILDVGGNTGKFAIACAKYDPNVTVKIVDHPKQTELALKHAEENGVKNQIQVQPMNLLDHSNALPKGFDSIWMSQFLDCFGEEDISKLMQRAYNAMSEDSFLYIMEPFTDNQRFEASKFCLDMTSLYFTCLANGNSRMYRSTDFHRLLNEQNLVVVESHSLRLSHTILKCKKK